MRPQDREALKRDDGRKQLVLSGDARGAMRKEYLTDTEFRRRMRTKDRREREQDKEGA